MEVSNGGLTIPRKVNFPLNMIIKLFSIVCWRSWYLCLFRWWRSRPMVSELSILRTKVWSPSSDFTFSVMTSLVGGGGGSSGLGEVQRANQQQWSLINAHQVSQLFFYYSLKASIDQFPSCHDVHMSSVVHADSETQGPVHGCSFSCLYF